MKRNRASRPTSRPSPTRFPRAQVSVIASNGRPQPPRNVRLAICHNLFWIPLEKEEKDAPRSLYDFRNASSLELTRRSGDDVTWDDIVNDIKPLDSCNLSFVVPGRLHGKERWTKLSGNVKLVITASRLAERDAWLCTIRMRVCSWQIMQRRAKELMCTGGGSVPMDILMNRMKTMCETTVDGQNVDDLAEVPSKYSRKGSSSKSRAASVSERVYSGTQKTDWVEKFNAQLSGLTGIIASAIEKVAKAVENATEATERIVDTAKDVADFAKFIPGGAGAVFQLVAVGARLAVMYAEANRGCRELPKLLPKIVELLVCVSRNVALILDATDEENFNDAMLEEYVFEVLVSTLDLLGTVETQLMRGKWGQFINSGVVKEVEESLSTLKTKVVSVALTEGMKGIRARVGALERSSNRNFSSIGQHIRPEVSPHFVGRRPELRMLRETLEKYGSVAITGLGGLGKTQLLAAFADRIFRDENSRRVVHWVIADGDARDVLESFASLIDHLSPNSAISAQDRTNRKSIHTALRDSLSSMEEDWLLCIDNVDGAEKSEVKGLLDSVASMTGNDGWVIVTSRAGCPLLWSRMKQEQNLRLQPLSERNARLLLWRMKLSLETNDASDCAIMEQVDAFEEENTVEFQALRELCGSELSYSLDGLPLALVQAGAYIRYRGCSFSKYLQVYKESSEKVKLSHMMRDSEESSPVRDDQRAILRTWKISVGVLPPAALSVLRVASMLGNDPIPEYLFKFILKDVVDVSEGDLEAQYSELVLNELAFRSSLLHRTSIESVDYFEMHRLVRLFLLVDMGEGSAAQDVAFNRALRSTHSCLTSRLESNGLTVQMLRRTENSQCTISSRTDPLDQEDSSYKHYEIEFLSHTHALVAHYQNRKICGHEQKLVDILVFTGKRLRWDGLNKDAEIVFQSLLELLYKIHGTDVKHPSIADAFCNLGCVYYFSGNDEKAELMFQKDLQMRYGIHGPDAKIVSIADALCRLGLAYQRNRKLELAESMYQQDLKMRYAIYGEKAAHPSIADALWNLGTIYKHRMLATNVTMRMKNLEKSEAYFRKNLKMKRAIHGSDSTDWSILNSCFELVRICVKLGKFEEVEKIRQELSNSRFLTITPSTCVLHNTMERIRTRTISSHILWEQEW